MKSYLAGLVALVGMGERYELIGLASNMYGKYGNAFERAPRRSRLPDLLSSTGFSLSLPPLSRSYTVRTSTVAVATVLTSQTSQRLISR